jgi:hypothetical protein
LIFIGILIGGYNILFANEDAAIANYKKTCKKCHGSAYYVAKVRTFDEWEKLFDNNAKNLYEAHKNDAKGMAKLNSNYFKTRLEDLKVFLMENGKDMGTVPPCNSTTCGFNVKLLNKKEKKKTSSLLKKAN